MSMKLTIPKLEMAMVEGTLAEWLVPDGAAVQKGDLIYSLETGKATQEIEAPAAGTLIHKVAAGQTFEVGTEIGEIL